MQLDMILEDSLISFICHNNIISTTYILAISRCFYDVL